LNGAAAGGEETRRSSTGAEQKRLDCRAAAQAAADARILHNFNLYHPTCVGSAGFHHSEQLSDCGFVRATARHRKSDT
jgi:hypothetical protein